MSFFKQITTYWHRYESLNLKIAFFLISLQILHLYWLTTDVVLHRIYGRSFFIVPKEALAIFIVVDYLEIPALIFGSIYYFFQFLRNFHKTDFLFLVFLLLQMLHLFWITDEIVYDLLFQIVPIAIPVFLAWTAIAVDYLELPIIIDLARRIAGKK
jgi:hypothetical protein